MTAGDEAWVQDLVVGAEPGPCTVGATVLGADAAVAAPARVVLEEAPR